MLLQNSEIKYPVPSPVPEKFNLSQWAQWYVMHIINGGRKVDMAHTYSPWPLPEPTDTSPRHWLSEAMSRQA